MFVSKSARYFCSSVASLTETPLPAKRKGTRRLRRGRRTKQAYRFAAATAPHRRRSPRRSRCRMSAHGAFCPCKRRGGADSSRRSHRRAGSLPSRTPQRQAALPAPTAPTARYITTRLRGTASAPKKVCSAGKQSHADSLRRVAADRRQLLGRFGGGQRHQVIEPRHMSGGGQPKADA